MNRIPELRAEKGISMRDAARMLGMPYTTYVNYEKGTREPNSETLIALANFYETSVDYLIGKSSSRTGKITIPPGFIPLPKMKKVPLIGAIACGDPITALQNREGEVDAPEDMRCDFALKCHGDSMTGAGIHDGDTVFIRIQPEVENGEIAAVRIGEEATLKRVYLHPDYIELRPENSAFESIIRRKEDMNDVQIEGKAVGWLHWV
ncbi:MAG: LexA family protein [Faecalibacterium prausnitzii]